MFNTTGHRYAKRRLLLGTVHSIMFYEAEIWAEQLRHKQYRRKLVSVQKRETLRVACAYRTVSEDAVLVIAKAMPIDLLAAERKRLHQLRIAGKHNDEHRAQETKRSIDKWPLR